MTTIIRLQNVEYTFNPGERNSFTVLSGVDLSVEAGEVLGVVGPSGSGKSTVLEIMSLLRQPTAGSVEFFGQPVGELSGSDMAELRAKHIGLVTQRNDLDPSLTAIENIQILSRLLGRKPPAKAQIRDLLQRLGLKAVTHRLSPGKLSVGEQQRVAIARAISLEPDVIFADEPTSALDAETKEQVLGAMIAAKPPQTAVVIVSHDDVVRTYCERIVMLRDRRLAGA